jgi:hypothetical protein
LKLHPPEPRTFPLRYPLLHLLYTRLADGLVGVDLKEVALLKLFIIAFLRFYPVVGQPEIRRPTIDPAELLMVEGQGEVYLDVDAMRLPTQHI